MRRSISYLILLLFCVGIVAASCARRPLDILTSGLKLSLSNDYTLPYGETASVPDNYRVNMYDVACGKLVYSDFVSEKGGKVKNIPGDYVCFVCNKDNGDFLFLNEDDSRTMTVTVPEATETKSALYAECRDRLAAAAFTKGGDSPVASELDGHLSPVLCIRENLWADSDTVTVLSLAESEPMQELELSAHSVLGQGRISVLGISGMEYVAAVECFFTNLASGINPFTGESCRTPAVLWFSLSCDGDGASGTFFHFGEDTVEAEAGHVLYLLITCTDGRKNLYVYALGPECRKGDMDYVINADITIFPPDPGTGGGFAPNIDDWNVEFNRVYF